MNNLFKSVIKALLICVITAAVLVFIFAFIANSSKDSTNNLRLFGMAAFFLSALVGSITAALGAEENRLAASLIFSGVFILICFGISLALGGGKLSELWIPYIGVLALSFIGALIGGKKKPKKPKNLKKFKKLSKA